LTDLNITNTGYIKYTLCNGTQEYKYIGSTGTYTLVPCIQAGSIQPGYPFADLAVFTITFSGASC
jgi:hypothetical protein